MMDITRGPGETLWVNGEQVWPKERAKSEQPAAASVVEEMLDAWYGDTEGLPPYDDLQRGGMTAAYEVARKRIEQEYGKDLIAEPKPALQEQIKTVLREAHRVSDDFDTTAAELIALVRQEIGEANER
jgi:hypothetical protein